MTKVYSFCKKGFGLIPVRVEATLAPGPPQIKILGLPNNLLKESQVRIRAALTGQGFQFPKSKQVLVNLKPNNIKKVSSGLDFAVAFAILLVSKQIKLNEKKVFVYGSLSLAGDVEAPDDIEELSLIKLSHPLYTGITNYGLPFKTLEIRELSQILNPIAKPEMKDPIRQSIEIQNLSLPKPIGETLFVAALGKHSLLIAGSKGTGKSTAARAMSSLMSPMDNHIFYEARAIHRYFHEDLTSPPVRSPHHTTTSIALVGGGDPPFPGEISKAHGGILILDELLEFSKETIDVLREPMEMGFISVSRHKGAYRFPAQFQLIATSNLCRCGEFYPSRGNTCRCRSADLIRYLNRLSGPLLDRFQMVLFCKNKHKETVQLKTLKEQLDEVKVFQKKQKGKKKNGLRALDQDFLSALTPRKRKNVLSVAHSISDMACSEELLPCHLQKAMTYAVEPQRKLEVEALDYLD